MEISLFDKAKWIWCENITKVNQYVDFYKEFDLVDALDKQVELFISADSDYSVRINGNLLDIHQYPDYPEYKTYERICVDEYVHPGKNKIEITAYCLNEDSFSYRKNIPGLLFAITLEEHPLVVSDETVLCRASKKYFSGEMEKITAQLSYSFSYDITAAEDADWCMSSVVPREVSLKPCPIRRLQVLPRSHAVVQAYGAYKEAFAAKEMGDRLYNAWLSTRHLDLPIPLPQEDGMTLSVDEGDGMYLLIDLGCETVGYFTVDVTVPHNCEMLIGYGEHIDDMRVRTRILDRQFAARVKLKAGQNEFTHRFKRLGCRYLQLHIASRDVTLRYAGLLPVVYPVTYREELPLKDHMHRRIAEVCRRTLELCMHDHYEDTPWREQGLYAMDSMIQMLCGYVVFDNPEFVASSLRLLGLGIREDGLLELCAPARTELAIPSFTMTWLMALRNYLQVYDDVSLMQEMRPMIEKVLAAFAERVDAEGIIHRFPSKEQWNFYEWTDGLEGHLREEDNGKLADAPAQAFYILGLEAAAQISRRLGDEEAALTYDTQRNRLKRAAERFWDGEMQAYISTIGDGARAQYHELTQALMICAGVTDAERAQQLLMRMTKPEDSGFIPVSSSCSLFKYMAFMEAKDKYEDFIWESILAIWEPIILSGSTSVWETSLGAWDFGGAGSMSHGWSAVPLWVYSQLLKE